MKQNKYHTGHIIDLFFTLALFVLFAASAFIVVIIGADVYKETTANMEENYSTRTAISYVTEKVRQHDMSGHTTLTSDGDDTMPVFSDITGNEKYLTYIYPYDGYLCELVIEEGTPFSKSQGERILKVDGFSIADAGNGFIKITSKDSGGSPVSCLLHLRSGQA